MANQIITKRKLQQATTRYGILLVLILIIGGYFGYQNYSEYQAAKAAQESEQAQLSQLKGSADKAKSDFLALKKDMDGQNSGVNQSIEKILPSNEDFTNLARDLDKYFLNTSATANAVFMSDLRFSQPKVDKGADYGVLPFSVTLSGNENGFKDFLTYVEKSGDLNDKTRLMDAGSINLNYQDNNKSADAASALANLNQSRQVNASLTMKAFYQKPLDETDTTNTTKK